MALRLFVAVELPADVAAALAAWGREALGGRDGVRLVDEAALHVTLCFLGSRAEEDVPRVAERLRPCTAGLSLAGALALPPRRPRVVAAAVADAPEGALAGLQAALSAELAAAGLHAPERRPFRPHVTVARVRSGARLDARGLPDPPALDFRAAAVTLFRSRTAPSGARYEALARAA